MKLSFQNKKRLIKQLIEVDSLQKFMKYNSQPKQIYTQNITNEPKKQPNISFLYLYYIFDCKIPPNYQVFQCCLLKLNGHGASVI